MKRLREKNLKKLKSNKEDFEEKKNGKEVCSVFISCQEPDEKGDMKVEMSYEGDPILASYLIETARGMIDI